MRAPGTLLLPPLPGEKLAPREMGGREQKETSKREIAPKKKKGRRPGVLKQGTSLRPKGIHKDRWGSCPAGTGKTRLRAGSGTLFPGNFQSSTGKPHLVRDQGL